MEEENFKEKLKNQIEEEIKKISEQGIESSNIEMLYELIDIHKDIENEEYWKVKKEVMQNDVRKLW